MRILMLVPHEGLGGPMPRILALLIDALGGLGCKVATAPWGRHVDAEGIGSKLLERPRDIWQVRRAASAFRPDCVVVQTSHDWPSITRDAALTTALRGRPVVLQMHGTLADRLVAPGNEPLKRATSLLLRLLDGVLVLSSEERRAFEAFQPNGRYEFVDNPFDGVGLAAGGVRRLAPEDEAVILFAGRLLPAKGARDAVEAVTLLNKHRSARLIVAGAGPAGDELASLVRERGLGNTVDLRGHLSSAALQDAYRDADVFLLPTYHPEGFPTVIAEAMAVGLPIVTTQARGNADHLENGVNALFVPAHDPAAIAGALEKLLEDHALRERMALANRAAVQKFAPARVAKDYLAALSRILD